MRWGVTGDYFYYYRCGSVWHWCVAAGGPRLMSHEAKVLVRSLAITLGFLIFGYLYGSVR